MSLTQPRPGPTSAEDKYGWTLAAPRVLRGTGASARRRSIARGASASNRDRAIRRQTALHAAVVGGDAGWRECDGRRGRVDRRCTRRAISGKTALRDGGGARGLRRGWRLLLRGEDSPAADGGAGRGAFAAGDHRPRRVLHAPPRARPSRARAADPPPENVGPLATYCSTRRAGSRGRASSRTWTSSPTCARRRGRTCCGGARVPARAQDPARLRAHPGLEYRGTRTAPWERSTATRRCAATRFSVGAAARRARWWRRWTASSPPGRRRRCFARSAAAGPPRRA